MNANLDLALSLLISAGIGLLVGLERERNPHTKAGLRTFTLIALAGSLTTLIGSATGSAWIAAVALAVIGISLAGAYFVDPATKADDSGTTTVVAALVVFCLGMLIAVGERLLAVALGVGMTALLHFKVELEGVARRLTPTDLRSILQFAAVSAIVLPLLPDRAFGPYGVLNPFRIWLMVVLISGISLAGYVAWRLTLGRAGVLLTGLLGGLVSSTATTLVAARTARRGTQPASAALLAILLANGTMFARVLLIAAVVAPAVALRSLPALAPALLLAALAALWQWRAAGREPPALPPARRTAQTEYRMPTHLPAALLFAGCYALVLLVGAWAADRIGPQGFLGLAFVSGLTDVDAITLTALQLFNSGSIDRAAAASGIALAVGANVLLKAGLVWAVGGRALGQRTLLAFLPTLLALAGGATLARWIG
ncbi:MAG: MgtC/SapB family protein [Burkholderiales bacterium]|nr:MgtC/SapB family protein [Burkholderiales bacterium]